MMLDWLGEKSGESNYKAAAHSLEAATMKTLADRITTPDLGGNYSTQQVATAVAERIQLEVAK
jgi:isocitrate/isopropylmalate dehydrogenase